MKSTLVPAQVTTVEDKVTGNLTITQLMLLIVPLFFGSAIFIVLPPFFNYAVYKIVVIICVTCLSAALAIRVKDKILLSWIITLLRFNLRPRHYVFDKNSLHNRDVAEPITSLSPQDQSVEEKEIQRTLSPTISELLNVENLIRHPDANLTFKRNKKGETSVYITEVK